MEFFNKIEAAVDSKIALLNLMWDLPRVIEEIRGMSEDECRDALWLARKKFDDEELYGITAKIFSEIRK